MNSCGIHGVYPNYEDNCPYCRAERQDLLEALAANSAAQANPGNFVCPHCKFKTLLWDASRCPKCQGSVSNEYWQQSRAQLEQSRKLREEADRRSACERQQKADVAAREAKHHAAVDRWFGLWVAYFILVPPSLGLVISLALIEKRPLMWAGAVALATLTSGLLYLVAALTDAEFFGIPASVTMLVIWIIALWGLNPWRLAILVSAVLVGLVLRWRTRPSIP